ncbi:MAG: BamA/TamA family outer membrane protein [Acidobacteriia bacterium]|nr:BamA/TamA family outer membrane protein [Terriglobia bacterium]
MAAPVLSALAAAALAWGTVPVAQVTVEAPGVADAERLRSVFGVTEGSVLSRAEIRAGVQAILATGEVEDAVVDLADTPAGALIHVRVQPASRVRSVEVLGVSKHEAKMVSAALGLSKNVPLRMSSFEAALERVRQLLRDRGYPRAALDPDLEFKREDASVAVLLHVHLGTPLLVRELAAPGAALTTLRLWEVCRLTPGRTLTAQNLEGARRRLTEFLRRGGFWEVEVDSANVREGPAGASVDFTVQRGPHWNLRLQGLKRSKSVEAEALPFVRGEETFSEAALDPVVTRLRTYLQRQGKLLAKVEGSVTDDGAGRLLTLTVDPGPRTAIVGLRFPGSHTLTERQLREKIGARPGHYWRWGGESLDEETLAADASSLLGTLRDAGLADAKVSDARVVPMKDGVEIEFAIEEGIRRTVERLEVKGVPPDVKQPRMQLAVGAPWSETAEEQARVGLESAIQEKGYADATVAASHDCGPERCTVELVAEAGAPSVIGRVVVAGLVKTRRGVVDTVSGIKSGQVAGPETQLSAQRRLLGLGIFERVDLHPIPGQGSGPRRGLVLDLKEGPSRALSYGVGYDTEQKARLSVTWSELSLFGTARSLSLDLRLSSLEKRIQATYREPERLGLLGIPTWISLYRTEDSFTSYNLLQRGMWFEFGDHFKRPFRTILRYEYLIVDPTAPPEILSQLERERQRDKIASITPSIEWDTRDDIFSPHRGVYLSFSWQSAFKMLMADAAFNKVMASASVFAPAQGGVLAVTIRGGAIQPQNHVPGTTDNLEIPINERFFAGGRVSQRAFPTDLLGIPNQTLVCQPSSSSSTPGCSVEATGGAGLLIASTEWRLPVYGPVGANLFVDGGNVWQAWRDVNVGAMRWGGGVGVRVDTPVGPLRLEYGWKFDRMSWVASNGTVIRESPGELFLSFGNAF